MFAFLNRRPAPPPAARKTELWVNALETRECPAVLLPKPSHDLVSAPPAPPARGEDRPPRTGPDGRPARPAAQPAAAAAVSAAS